MDNFVFKIMKREHSSYGLGIQRAVIQMTAPILVFYIELTNNLSDQDSRRLAMAELKLKFIEDMMNSEWVWEEE
jgi:F0F1-type ATP synthase membrane subunit a